ncbi:hypothetical protein J2Y55_002150 [Bosea sp. BE125]|uniref:hypothetical protein n=1 Tax=Bosea sp. BE125 TaxID=2817909 RepID=UPI00285DC308|nr:hypothetical protein [Bosea sp. BE125]MDR6871142.1 hypothetical protein [Bosea sp. BE125]
MPINTVAPELDDVAESELRAERIVRMLDDPRTPPLRIVPDAELAAAQSAREARKSTSMALLKALRDNRPDNAAKIFGLKSTTDLRRAAPKAANDNAPVYPGIVSSRDFVAGFVPPDYHVDHVAQAGFIYSVTAMTGTGKTAVMLLIAALTALGGTLGDHEVRKGRVL